jgi:hypothetical protein
MIKLEDKTNVIAPTVEYPYGSIKDNTGASNGTPVNRELFSDGMQLFEKMMAESGITANGLPDNFTNGFQLYLAFRKLTKPYKGYVFNISQSGASAPTVAVLGLNEIGTIVWTRTTTGVYVGTLVGAFPTSLTWTTTTFRNNSGTGYLFRTGTDTVEIRTFNTGGTAADSILLVTSLEIRAYDY